MAAGANIPAIGQLEICQWVQCDHCSKWRRIPQSVADGLSDEEPWYCEHNESDPDHNNCDAPQELADAEIDRLHEQNEAAGHAAAPGGGAGGGASPAGDGGGDGGAWRHKRPPVWQLITDNLYTHRERKQQDEDDIMICQCKKIWATDHSSVGCGPECLNRMLNIECVEEYCPSGHRCTNQMFTKRQYSKLDVKRAGAKGFGLFAAEDMKAGQFVIEYLGEVLEEEEYHRRKEYFMETGQRHYYFMNVGNGEVIDASRKGNLGRFINHSCEPNCETQKWVVHGELAIGLFTLVDIKAGTELTFDYNFERYGDKPMKCLCGSKNCRGVIGGTQDKEAGAAARAAVAAEAAIEVPEEEQDPDFIMVTEKEQDAVLTAILDRVVGLGWDKGWTPKLSARLHKLASQHGVDLANLSEDEEEEEEEEGVGSGMSDGEEPAQAAAPSGRQKQQKAAAAAAGRKAGGAGKQQKAAAAGRARKPAAAPRQQRKAAAAASSDESDWGAELSAASSSGSESESELEGQQRSSGSRGEEAAERARQGRGGASAQAAAKAAALAAAELPFRKRLKSFARAAVAAEAASTTPAGSTGSRQQQQQQQRPGSATARATQSVASSTPAGSAAATATAVSAPLIPKRSVAGGGSAAPVADRWGFGKRRSEIDRRLEDLVNSAGRLRDPHPDVIIRVLRLFNLCEIGPTVSKMESDSVGDPQQQQQQRPGSGGGGGGGGPQRSDVSAPYSGSAGGGGGGLAAAHQNGSASDLRQAALVRPPSRNDSVGGGGGGGGAGGQQREDGEVSPQHSGGAGGGERQQHHYLQPPQQHSSPGKDRRAEASSRIRAAWDEAQRSGQLSARQQARIADMSLLLDVVLKTNTLSAKKDFIRCGLLRQLLGVVGGNTGRQYGVILKKMLRVIESLPLTADDMHHTRSAHGSFADLLRELATSTDFEIRSKAYNLLRSHPVQNCTRPLVYDGAMHSSAGSSRSRAMGAGTPGGMMPGGGGMTPGGGLPPPHMHQRRDSGPPPPLALPPPPMTHSPFGGGRGDAPPPPAAHYHHQQQQAGPFWDSPHQQQWEPHHPHHMPPHDGYRSREPMPPSRFGPGRPGPGGRPPTRPGPPPPPHMHPHPPYHHGSGSPGQHLGLPRPPPPGMPPPQQQQQLVGTPGANGAAAPPRGPPDGSTPASSSRKRTRWDQPAAAAAAAQKGDDGGGAGGAAAAAGGAGAGAATPGSGAGTPGSPLSEGQVPGSAAPPQPRGTLPPGFGSAGGIGGWARPGAVGEEPPSKRLAGGAGATSANGHVSATLASLAAAPSWDVETQFAVGTYGSGSYLTAGTGGAGAGGGGGNLSPDRGSLAPAGGAHTYSPPAGGSGAGVTYSPEAPRQAAAAAAADGGGSSGRPMSAAYSQPPDQRQRPHDPAAAPANGGGMHLSPMSDDDDERAPGSASPSKQQQVAAAAAAQEQEQEQEQQAQQEQTWDSPDASFAAFVADMVRRRVGKYEQPDHPMWITQEEASQLYSKIRREIVAKEQSAYDARQAAGVFKPIERSKLESKIREFVRDSIRRYKERQGHY